MKETHPTRTVGTTRPGVSIASTVPRTTPASGDG